MKMNEDSFDYKTLICIENAEIVSYKHSIEYISSAFSENQDHRIPDLLTVKKEIVTVLDDGKSSNQDFDKQLSSENRSKISASSRELLASGTFQVYEFNGLIYMSCGRGRSISSANIIPNSGNTASNINSGSSATASSNAFVYPLLPKLRIFRIDKFEFVLALFFPQRFWRIRFDVMYQPSKNQIKDYKKSIGYQIASDDGFDKEILLKQVDLLQRIFEKYCNFKDLSSDEFTVNSRTGNSNISNQNNPQKSRTRDRLSKLFKPKSKKLIATTELVPNSQDKDVSVLSSPDFLNNLIDEKVERKLRTLQTGSQSVSHRSNLSDDKRSTNIEEVYSNLTDSTTAVTSFATNGNVKSGNSAAKKSDIPNANGFAKHSESISLQNNYRSDQTKQINDQHETDSCFSSHESAYNDLQEPKVTANESNLANNLDSMDSGKKNEALRKIQINGLIDEGYEDLNEDGYKFHQDVNEDVDFRGSFSQNLNNEVLRDILEMKKSSNKQPDEQYRINQELNQKSIRGSLRKPRENHGLDNQNILYSKSTEWMDFNDQIDEKENKLNEDQDLELDNVLINFSVNDLKKKSNGPARRIPKIEYEPSHHRKLKMRDEVQSYYSTRSFRSLKGTNRLRNPTEQITGVPQATKNAKRTQNTKSREVSTDYFGNADYRSIKLLANSGGKHDFRNDGGISEVLTARTNKSSNYTNYRRLAQTGMMLSNKEIFNLVMDEDDERVQDNLKENMLANQNENPENSSGLLTKFFGW